MHLDHIENLSSNNQIEQNKHARETTLFSDRRSHDTISVQHDELHDAETINGTIMLKSNTTGLIDVIMASTLDLKLYELMKQEESSSYNMQIIAWEHRHTCLLQTFKLILTQYFKRQQVTSEEYTNTLTAAEKMLAKAMRKYQRSINDEYKHSLDNSHKFDSIPLKEIFQATYQMVEDMQNVCSAFESSVLGGEDKEVIHSGLVKITSAVEEKIRTLNEYKLEELNALNHRQFLVVQAFHGGNIALLESIRTRRSYVETILQRLSKAGHLTHDASGQLWNQFKAEIESVMDDTTAELEESLRGIQQQSIEQRKSIFQQIEQDRSQALQKLLDRGGQKLKIRNFVEEYFATLMEFYQHESTARHQLTNNEAAQAAKVQKIAKLNLSVRCDEAQEKLLLHLSENQILNAHTARQLMDELGLKIKEAEEEVSAVNVAQTQLVEREAKLTVEAMRNAGGVDYHVTTDSTVRDQREIVQRFVTDVHYLNESDRSAVLAEYDTRVALLRNLVDVIRVQVFRFLDRELTERQLRAISLVRGEQQLKTDEDVRNLAQRLGEMREAHFDKFADLYRAVGTLMFGDWLKQQIFFVCGVAAKRLVANLVTLEEEERRENQILKSIKGEVSGTLLRSRKLDHDQLENLVAEHRRDVSAVERNLRQSHDIQLQLSKERLNSAQQLKVMKLQKKEAKLLEARPQSPSNFTISEVLDRLLEQVRNQRKIENLESDNEVETSTHVYFQRLAFNQSLNSELQKLDKGLMTKIAVAGNLTKQQFLKSVRNGLVAAFANESELNTWPQEFARLWPKRAARSMGRTTSRSDEVTWAPDVGNVPSRGRKGRSFLKRVAHANA
uniref:Uncharacterized protein LOC100180484 n=1 Tax=Phallusia mammillata TaxID=59560 RepID=A0A6F9DI54_9ASCI|nr:uncharacterized protein LOC100180484 [Phallusia mammillata]